MYINFRIKDHKIYQTDISNIEIVDKISIGINDDQKSDLDRLGYTFVYRVLTSGGRRLDYLVINTSIDIVQRWINKDAIQLLNLVSPLIREQKLLSILA